MSTPNLSSLPPTWQVSLRTFTTNHVANAAAAAASAGTAAVSRSDVLASAADVFAAHALATSASTTIP